MHVDMSVHMYPFCACVAARSSGVTYPFLAWNRTGNVALPSPPPQPLSASSPRAPVYDDHYKDVLLQLEKGAASLTVLRTGLQRRFLASQANGDALWADAPAALATSARNAVSDVRAITRARAKAWDAAVETMSVCSDQLLFVAGVCEAAASGDAQDMAEALYAGTRMRLLCRCHSF